MNRYNDPPFKGDLPDLDYEVPRFGEDQLTGIEFPTGARVMRVRRRPGDPFPQKGTLVFVGDVLYKADGPVGAVSIPKSNDLRDVKRPESEVFKVVPPGWRLGWWPWEEGDQRDDWLGEDEGAWGRDIIEAGGKINYSLDPLRLT